MAKWLRNRAIPKNRAFVNAFLAKCGLNANRPMDVISICKEEIKVDQNAASPRDKYELHYTIAGYWRMAMVWIEEDDALSPEQMSEIAVNKIGRSR